MSEPDSIRKRRLREFLDRVWSAGEGDAALSDGSDVVAVADEDLDD